MLNIFSVWKYWQCHSFNLISNQAICQEIDRKHVNLLIENTPDFVVIKSYTE